MLPASAVAKGRRAGTPTTETLARPVSSDGVPFSSHNNSVSPPHRTASVGKDFRSSELSTESQPSRGTEPQRPDSSGGLEWCNPSGRTGVASLLPQPPSAALLAAEKSIRYSVLIFSRFTVIVLGTPCPFLGTIRSSFFSVSSSQVLRSHPPCNLCSPMLSAPCSLI